MGRGCPAYEGRIKERLNKEIRREAGLTIEAITAQMGNRSRGGHFIHHLPGRGPDRRPWEQFWHHTGLAFTVAPPDHPSDPRAVGGDCRAQHTGRRAPLDERISVA